MTGNFQGGTRGRVRHISFDENTEFAGLDMRIGGVSVDEWLTMTERASFAAFCERLVEWNWIGDAGELVPITPEAIGALDAGDIRTLINHWLEQVAGVRSPLVRRQLVSASTNGAIETELPMEPTAETNDVD